MVADTVPVATLDTPSRKLGKVVKLLEIIDCKMFCRDVAVLKPVSGMAHSRAVDRLLTDAGIDAS